MSKRARLQFVTIKKLRTADLARLTIRFDKALLETKKLLGKPLPKDILIVLGSDSGMKRLKHLFWGKPAVSDVVSFNYGKGQSPQWEIFINLEQAKRQAKTTFADEIVFLFIHGVLHNLGYDDDTPRKRAHMLELGSRILASCLSA
ncbi:MAG: rRNA maturation RNase YbeY [Elusimicrobiota bacterium]